MNPCPCGYHGDVRHLCRCTPQQTARYRGRLSGPLRDRLDLVVEVQAVPVRTLTDAVPGESSASVRTRVLAARDWQLTRNVGRQGARLLNMGLTGRDLRSTRGAGRRRPPAAGALGRAAQSLGSRLSSHPARLENRRRPRRQRACLDRSPRRGAAVSIRRAIVLGFQHELKRLERRAGDQEDCFQDAFEEEFSCPLDLLFNLLTSCSACR